MAATRKISTLVAVEGDKAYKQALTAINTELKAMESRMRLVTAECAGNANSEEALTKKGDALRNVIAAQQKKVEALTAAMRNAQNAQDKWAEEADKAKQDFDSASDAVSKLDDNSRNMAECYRTTQKQIQNAQAELRQLQSTSSETSDSEAILKGKIDSLNATLAELDRKSNGAAKGNAELLERQERLGRELQAVNGKMTSAGNTVNRYQTQINNAQVKILDLDVELRKNSQYLDEARSSADHCATSIDRFGREVRQTGGECREGSNEIRGVGESVDALSSILMAVGVQKGLRKISDALHECVEASADFSYTMSTVRAVTGAGGEEMAALSTQAKEYAASTIYYAQDIADAYATMGRAGFTASEMLAALPGVVALASASGEGLADVTSTMADNLTAFGDGADQAARYADVLAQTAAKSNTTVANLSDAFKMAASTAGGLGYSVEDLSVWLAAMANQGIKGSMAGSAVTTALSRMAGGTDEAADKLEDLGVSMFDARGNARDLDVFLDDLRTAFSGLTEEEKENTATTLAGIRGKKALLTLVNTSADDWNLLTEAINNSTGAAERMADVQLDNYTGKVALLKSAAEELKITVGDQLTPAFGDLAEAGTDALGWMSELLKTHEDAVPIIGGTVTAIGAFVGIMTVAVAAVKVFQIASASLGAALGPVAVALGIISVAVGALSSAFIASANDSDAAATKVKESAERWQQAKDAYQDATEEMNNEHASIDALVTELYGLADGTSVSVGEQERIAAIISELNELVPELALSYDRTTNSINKSKESVRAYTNMLHAQEKVEAERDKYTAAVEERKKAEEALNQALKEQAESQKKVDAIREGGASGRDRRNAVVDLEFRKYAVEEAKKHLDELDAAVDASSEALSQAESELNGYTAKWENFARAAADADLRSLATDADSASGSAEELSDAYNDLAARFDTVKENGSEAAVALAEQRLEALELRVAVASLEEGYGAFVRVAGVNLEELAGYLSANGISVDEWGESFETNLDKVTNGFSRVGTDMGLDLEEIKTNLESNALAYSTWQENINLLMQEAVTNYGEDAVLFVQYVKDMGVGAADQVSEMVGDMSYTFNEIVPAFSGAAKSAVDGANLEFGYGADNATEIGKSTSSAYAEGIKQGKEGSATSAKTLADETGKKIDTLPSKFYKTGSKAGDKLSDAINGKTKKIEQTCKDITAAAAKSADQPDLFRQSGLHCAQGLAAGIRSGASDVRNAASALVTQALATIRATAGEHSPWATTRKSGQYGAAGLALGMRDNMGLVIREATEVSRAAVKSLSMDSVSAPTANTRGAYAYYRQAAMEPMNHGSADGTGNAPQITTYVYLGNRQVAEAVTDQVITEINGRVVQERRGKGR